MLAVNGQSLLSGSGSGALQIEGSPVLRRADGSETTLPDSNASGKSTRSRASSVTRVFSWGSVHCNYSVHGNELRFGLSVRNTTRDALTRLHLRLLEPEFPATPQCTELDAGQFGMGGGSHPMGEYPIIADPRAAPPLIFMDYGNASLAYCCDTPNSDAVLRVSAGLNPPAKTRFGFTVAPGEITGGKTVNITVSLRFGPHGSTIRELAGNTLSRYAAAFPFQLHWSDRRPIGELFLATNGKPHPVSNPRGWLNNASAIDVTTPAGLQGFRDHLLHYADESVRILKAMNAQGMIVWDPEGQEFAAATYYGDPRIASKLAPETDYKGSAPLGCLDAFFAKFREAGLRCGICVRPQEIQFVAGVPMQRDSPDPAETLKRKIAFARKRWGCTLFYVDSTVKGETALDADVFRQVASAFPDVLLMPENETLRDYAYSAPLNSFQHHTVVSTPPGARMVYPHAFSVLLAGEGDVAGHRAELVAAVRRGDILLFHGWWPNPNNAVIKSIYEEAHAAIRANPVQTLQTPSATPMVNLKGTTCICAM